MVACWATHHTGCTIWFSFIFRFVVVYKYDPPLIFLLTSPSLGCVVWAEDKIWTSVQHNNTELTHVRGTDPENPYTMTLDYGSSMEQLEAVIDGSEHCEQEVAYHCRKSRLLNTPGKAHPCPSAWATQGDHSDKWSLQTQNIEERGVCQQGGLVFIVFIVFTVPWREMLLEEHLCCTRSGSDTQGLTYRESVASRDFPLVFKNGMMAIPILPQLWEWEVFWEQWHL